MKRPDDIPQEDLSDLNQKALDEAVLRLLRAGTHDIVKVGTVPPWMEHVPDGEGAWGYPRGLVVDGCVVYRMRAEIDE